MIRFLTFTAVTIGSIVTVCGAEPEDDRPPAYQPKFECLNTIEGKVTRVTQSEIAVRSPGEPVRKMPFTARLSAGKKDTGVVWYLGVQPPVKMIGPSLGSHEDYRPQDVQAGDEVRIKRCLLDEVEHCTSICILRRPGGQVPAPPWEKFLHFGKGWADQMNAEQAFEESCTPLPQWYRDWDPKKAAWMERKAEILKQQMKLPANNHRPETGPNPLPPPVVPDHHPIPRGR